MALSIVPAHAITEDAEIVLTDVWITPIHPQSGDKVTINGNVYNGGIMETSHYASVVTAAFFIDGELRKIIDIGNIQPGSRNNVIISSGPIWDAEWGKHNMTVIINYHHTLSAMYDNPENNIVKKIFTIEPVKSSQISVDAYPSYIIPNKDNTITINGSLVDSNTGAALSKQNIILKIGNETGYLTTDKDGKFTTTKAITFPQQRFLVTSSYAGNFPYLPSNSTSYVFNLPPSDDTSALVLQIKDPNGKYNFQNLPSSIAVFQDSYASLYAKVSTSKQGVLLDNNTAWISLPGNHSYLEEIYAKGRFFFSTDFDKIPENNVLQKNLYIPDTAQIKFHLTDQNNNPLRDASITNWIYSSKTDETGYTGWIDMLPTMSSKEPYVTMCYTSDGKILRSEPFFVASGEKKIIEIKEANQQIVIPSWVKNNAKFWANDQIPTADFVGGIQYLIEQKIIVIPLTSATSADQSQHVPFWVKNNAKWWSEGMISDSDFVAGIQYLIQNGIIHV